MKRFNNIFLICALIVGAVFTSCKDDETQPTPEYKTPEFKINGAVATEITSTPSQNEGTISFMAEGVWSVSVDKIWISLDKKTGGAGEQIINYTIEKSGLNYDDVAEGNINFVMGNQELKIKVTRLPKERELEIMKINDDGELVPATSVDVQFNADQHTYYIIIDHVKGNFDWTITGLPNWIKDAGVDEDGFKLTFGADRDVIETFNLDLNVENFVINQAMAGDIIFGSANGEFEKSLAVNFAGIDDTFVNLDRTLPLATRLSDKGFVVEGLDLMETEKLGYDFKASAAGENMGIYIFLDDEYDGLVYMPQVEGGYPTCWLHIEEAVAQRAAAGDLVSTKHFTVRADVNTAQARVAQVYILPQSIHETIVSGGDMLIYNEDLWKSEINPIYESYMVTTLTQELAVSKPMFTIGNEWGQGNWDATLTEVTDTAIHELYGTSNVYTLDLGPEADYTRVNMLGYTHYESPTLEEKGDAIYDANNIESGLDEMNGVMYTAFTWFRNTTTSDKESVLYFKYVADDQETGAVAGDNYGVLLMTQKPSASMFTK